MSYATATVKWGKEKQKGFDVPAGENAADTFAKLQAALAKRFSVPADRQKIMCRGKVIGADNMYKVIKKGGKVQLVLVGSVGEIKEAAPSADIKFMEDIKGHGKEEEELIPPGLDNLGNTCYLNATVQALKAVPDLNKALITYSKGGPTESGASAAAATRPAQHRALASTLGGLFEEMATKHNDSVTPARFVAALKQFYPQFAQTTPRGAPMQHDADEFLGTITSALKQEVAADGSSLGATSTTTALSDELFGIGIEQELRCAESEEVEKKTMAPTYKLVCNIQKGSGSSDAGKVDFVNQGLRLALLVEQEKRSAKLGRNAIFQGKQTISKLPKYLCVQYMRFFFKRTPNSRDHQGVPCKILRKVQFDTKLDLFEYCSPEAQAALKAVRDDVEKRRDAKISAAAAGDAEGVTESKNMDNGASKDDVAMAEADGDDDVMDEELKAALAMSLEDDEAEGAAAAAAAAAAASATMEVDSGKAAAGAEIDLSKLPADFAGTYELISVVTHKGRDSSSGHYIGYAKDLPKAEAMKRAEAAGKGAVGGKKKKKKPEPWLKFDDDVVYESDWDEVKLLCGGGDREMVYLAFYRAVGEEV